MSDISDIGARGEAREWLNGLAKELSQYSFNYSSEDDLQRGMAQVFDAMGEPYEREHRLSKEDRIDFYFPMKKVGVEVKIDHPLSALTRQLMRYVQHEAIDGLMLVSGKMRLTNMPDKMNGKPLVIHSLLGSLL